MSKRLQVLFDKEEVSEFRRIASQQKLSLAAWVRQTLRQAVRHVPEHPRKAKLLALERAFDHKFALDELEDMLAQIESGYVKDSSS